MIYVELNKLANKLGISPRELQKRINAGTINIVDQSTGIVVNIDADAIATIARKKAQPRTRKYATR